VVRDDAEASGFPAASLITDLARIAAGRVSAARDKMAGTHPSCNTDQGVHHHGEFVGVKPMSGMKVKVSGYVRAPRIDEFPTRGLCISMGGVQLRCLPPYKAMLLGPERCVSYAWAGSSRRKRRGRAESVLTCKSFVRGG